MKKILFILSTIALLALIVTLTKPSRTELSEHSLNTSLHYSGQNRVELEKALQHFKTQPDSLKLAACRFLIKNMIIHSAEKYVIQSSDGSPVDYNPSNYKTYSEAKAVRDSLIDTHRLKRSVENDLSLVKAEYLINTIELAFAEWRKARQANVSFNNFCEYILPYRILNENLSSWRSEFHKMFNRLIDTTERSDDIDVLIHTLQSEAYKLCSYNFRAGLRLGFGSIKELIDEGNGTCEKYTAVTTAALRSVGIASTIDKTTWAHRNSSHYWNVVVNDSVSHPIVDPHLHWATKVAKVFRYQYAYNDSPLFEELEYQNIPPQLREKNILDVTNLYVNTIDIELEVGSTYNAQIVYLNFFNSGEWKTAEWSKVQNGKAVFKNMGLRDIVYLPALYTNGEYEAIGSPFIMNKDSTIKHLDLNLNETTDYSLTQTNLYWTDFPVKKEIKKGEAVELFYWNRAW